MSKTVEKKQISLDEYNSSVIDRFHIAVDAFFECSKDDHRKKFAGLALADLDNKRRVDGISEALKQTIKQLNLIAYMIESGTTVEIEPVKFEEDRELMERVRIAEYKVLHYVELYSTMKKLLEKGKYCTDEERADIVIYFPTADYGALCER